MIFTFQSVNLLKVFLMLVWLNREVSAVFYLACFRHIIVFDNDINLSTGGRVEEVCPTAGRQARPVRASPEDGFSRL